MIKGRGAGFNPHNRFEKLVYESAPSDDAAQPESTDDLNSPLHTELFRDTSKSILSYNDSPDVGFDVGINPYRGCEHGCVYCYARPTHEYLGFSSGLDFESKIMVKEEAPELLRKELSSPKWKPQSIALSGNTDCYQPVERKLKITRRCLEVLAEFRNPVVIITKNHLVTRDIDLLSELAKFHAVHVRISVTSLDPHIARIMEPRASAPSHRLDAIRKLSEAEIPVGVMVAPVVPAVTDSEIPAILSAAAEAGAQWASYVMLRLPYAVKNLFENWLERYFPDRKEKVLNRLRSMRDGKLYDAQFGSRMKGEGLFAEQVARLFQVAVNKSGLNQKPMTLSADSFVRKNNRSQLELWI